MIPTALAVDESAGPDDVAAVFRDRGVADRPFVVYCAVGLRSAWLVARWGRHGPPALHLRGGIFRWFREGRALAEGRTAVHPFDDRWGRLLPADR